MPGYVRPMNLANRLTEAWRVLFETGIARDPTTPLSAPAGWLFDMLGGSPRFRARDQ